MDDCGAGVGALVRLSFRVCVGGLAKLVRLVGDGAGGEGTGSLPSIATRFLPLKPGGGGWTAAAQTDSEIL